MSVTGDEGRRNVMQHMRAMGLGDPSTAAGTLTEEQLRDLQAEADLRVETTRGARFEMQGDDINAIKIYKSLHLDALPPWLLWQTFTWTVRPTYCCVTHT